MIELGGVSADLGKLMYMHTIADRLFGVENYEWSVLAAGRHQIPCATQAAHLGGNLRIGLEDSLFIGKGELVTSNAQQVRKIRGIVENLGLEVATPEEARERLAFKGRGLDQFLNEWERYADEDADQWRVGGGRRRSAVCSESGHGH